MTLKIRYDYKHTKFEITPQSLSFVPQKANKTSLNIMATSESQIGLMLQYKLWRIPFSVGMLINKEINGVALVGIGFEF